MAKENNGLIRHQSQINGKKYGDQGTNFDLAENQEILMNQNENNADRCDQVLENQG